MDWTALFQGTVSVPGTHFLECFFETTAGGAQQTEDMFHLDYISCLLSILSTILIGKRLWHGWIIAGINSIVICVIGVQTAQYGLLPGNLLCIVLYAHNLSGWRPANQKEATAVTMEDDRKAA